MSLPHDFLGLLVLAQAEEARMAEAAVAGPLAESDLGDEPRLDPGGAALAQRQLRRVLAVQVEQVEDVEEHGHRPLAALLEPGEAGLRAVEGHDLAVEHEVRRGLALERLDDLREPRVEAEVVAREQPHARFCLDGDAADAVELAFEDPAGVGEPLLGQHRLHRLDAVGERGHSSSIVRPLTTDSGWVLTGLRRASASSSRRLISSHWDLPVRWSVQPPRSFSPSSQNERWPSSSASSTGPSVSGR